VAFHTQHAAFEDGEQTNGTGTDYGDIGMLLGARHGDSGKARKGVALIPFMYRISGRDQTPGIIS
jgi:hypothetical protein